MSTEYGADQIQILEGLETEETEEGDGTETKEIRSGRNNA